MHITSNKSFMLLIAVSAMILSTIAAVFSVTGISALFSGYALTVGIMMSALEFAKVVVASFISKFWKQLTIVFKIYFVVAVMILISITSAGIFGYLTDAYQQTKGNYTMVSADIKTFSKKLDIFNAERMRYEKQLKDQSSRLDTVYANQNDNNQWTANTRITNIDKNIETINVKLTAINDSISVYESKKTQRETELTTGDVGPLKYIADVFGSDIDTVVKYLILLLIFVFDPLAILLFVTVNRFPTITSTTSVVESETPKTSSVLQIGDKFKDTVKNIWVNIKSKPNTSVDTPEIPPSDPVEQISTEIDINTPVVDDDSTTTTAEPVQVNTDEIVEQKIDDLDSTLLDYFTPEELSEMENGLDKKDATIQRKSSNFKHSL